MGIGKKREYENKAIWPKKAAWFFVIGSLYVAPIALAGDGVSQREMKAIQALPKAFKDHSCIACHGVDGQRVGPAFRWIARRYDGATDRSKEELVRKIIEGGGGKWGVVPMIAHPSIDRALVRDMVEYILKMPDESGNM